MSAPAALAGLRVIVTRPAHQAENLCLVLEQQGAEAVRLPVFTIEASGDPAAQRGTLGAQRKADGWIFTSANAVRFAAALDDGHWPTLFAVGGATAAALAQAGHPGAIAPETHSSSEALLELPAFAHVDGRHYLIITGEDGRDLLASELARRGAGVETLTLYGRRPIDHAPARIAAELQTADVTVLTSGQALDRLWKLTSADARPALLRQQLMVPSGRVAEQAQQLGFGGMLVPETVSDDAILRCLVRWRATATSPDPGVAPELSKSSPAVEPPASAAANAPAGSQAARGSAAKSLASAPTPQTGGGSALAWALVLILAIALCYGGWLFWELHEDQAERLVTQDNALRRLAQRADELDSQAAQLTTRQSDTGRIVQRESTDLAALQGRLDNSEQLMGRLTDELQGGRTRFALASVEQLLLLANDRLLLERDVRGALLALQIADQRLGQINDPRLFKVREAIAQERSRLQALPRPDFTSVSLSLSSLIDRAGSLPLRARVAPRHFGNVQGASAGADAGDAQQPWPARVWASVREAVAGLFVVRRDDNANTLRLLPVEDEAVIVHVLILRLESARFALLRDDTQSFRESMRSAADWLRQFFREDDAGVAAALAEIERLQPLELSAPPPDIGGSLALLRQVLESPPP